MQKFRFKHKFFSLLLGIFLTFIILEFLLHFLSSVYSKIYLPRYNNFESTENVYRILCLGDSITYGIGAGFENSYPVQLEQILNEKVKGQKFKIFNLGVPGYNSAQVLQTLKKNLAALKPNMVIVLVGDNDFWNFRQITWQKSKEWNWLNLKILLSNLKIYNLFEIFSQNLRHKTIKGHPSLFFPRVSPKTKLDANGLIEQGNINRDKKYFEKAKLFYKQALSIDPGNRTAFLELGRCYKLADEFGAAVETLASVFRVYPNDEQIQQELTDVFIRQNKIEKTIEFYGFLLEKYPQNEYARKQLFNAYKHLGGDFYFNYQLRKAIDTYCGLYRLDPKNKKSYFNILNNLSIEKNMFENLKKMVEVCKEKRIFLLFSGYPQKMPIPLQRIAVECGNLLIDLQPVFREIKERYPDHKYFIEDSYHCTREGYRLIAEKISEEIIKHLNDDKTKGKI